MSIRIGIGSGLATPLSPDDYWRWIALCEDGGIDSIWHSDLLVGPNVEPLTMLAALSAATRRLRFGANALLAAFRDPLLLAKQFATIDFLSPGRLLPSFAVGAAWDPFWAATGRNPAERGRRTSEAIALVRSLLEQDEVSFEGTYYRHVGPGVQPRPAKPIPLWVGGESEAAIRRTAMLGDGWLGGLSNPSSAGEAVLRIKAALTETERVIDPDHYGVSLPFRIGSPDDPAVIAVRNRLAGRVKSLDSGVLPESFAIGTPAEITALLQRYVEAGISKFVMLPMVDDARDMLDQTALLAAEILPLIEDRPELL